ncbi:MAG: 5'/3'-nucleotidase SurE [Ignavibacteria bacterium]
MMDGIESDGIKALWKEIKKFAEVYVVAPHTC